MSYLSCGSPGEASSSADKSLMFIEEFYNPVTGSLTSGLLYLTSQVRTTVHTLQLQNLNSFKKKSLFHIALVYNSIQLRHAGIIDPFQSDFATPD